MALADSKLGMRARKENKFSFCYANPLIYRIIDKSNFVHGAYLLDPKEQIPELPAATKVILNNTGFRQYDA